MKVALIFWGLTRSLKYTLESIHKNIFDVLKEHSIEYDVFIHTYNIKGTYYNPRAGEKELTGVCSDDCVKLNPTKYMIDIQEEVQKDINLLQYRSKGNPWGGSFHTLDNFITAMYSKMKATELCFSTGNDYDCYLFLRPDVLYLNPIDVSWLTSVNDTTIMVPNFHHTSWKFNDRAAICNKRVAELYGNIFTDMLDYSKQMKLHSETIHLIHMKKYGVSPEFIHFRFNRVRITGKVGKDCTA
jgi:hypothetical protein